MRTDFLVIGSGVAGLSFALKAADYGRVDVLTKAENPQFTSTQKAQGGIAAVWSGEDSLESHVNDTLCAGDYLNDRRVVEPILAEGPERIKDLIRLGAKFTRNSKGKYALTREAAHSHDRILRAGDMTGIEVEKTLFEAAKAKQNIHFHVNHVAVDLVVENNQCIGAYVLDKESNKVKSFEAKVTVLATGGCGKVYLYTSNPDLSTGDGIAMAYRATASIANMEFMQFHPTCLYNPEAKNFLISEAVRGEGAKLVNKKGKEFCNSMAPRDEVARAIDRELKESGREYVYLDILHLGKQFILKRFPGIYGECLKYGIDITEDVVPVVPAAHYSCGGVKTNVYGETDVSNLFAVGEVSCTGLHGANRLASNSLIEALVVGRNAAEKAAELVKELYDYEIRPWYSTTKPVDRVHEAKLDAASFISSSWDEIRRLMWNYVGIVRTSKRMEMANQRIDILQKKIDSYYRDLEVSSDMLELRNVAAVAKLIIKSALRRKESIGLHHTLTYPNQSDHSGMYNIIKKSSP